GDGPQHQGQRDPPAGAVAHRKQGGGPMEAMAEGQQGEEDDGEEGGFLVVEPFGQRGEDADEEQDEGGGEGGADPSAQGVREEQEPETGDAGEKMRDLDDREREPAGEELHALVEGGDGAGDQERGASRKA